MLTALVQTACAPQTNTNKNLVMLKLPTEVVECKHLGHTNVALNNTRMILLIDAQKIEQTLGNEAQNLATRIGANAIVLDKKNEKNQQAFRFYICPQT